MTFTDKENYQLDHLQNHEKAYSEFFHLNIVIQAIGSFIGWVFIAVFLFATGLPSLFISIFGFIQMLLLLLVHSKYTLSFSLSVPLMILGHFAFFIGLYVSFNPSLIYLILIELFISALALLYYHSKIYHFLQITFLFLLIFMLPTYYDLALSLIILLWTSSLLFLLYLWIHPLELLLSSRLALMLIQSFFLLFAFDDDTFFHHLTSSDSLHTELLHYLSVTTTIIFISFIFYAFKPFLKNTFVLTVALCFSLLSWFVPQPLALPLLFLALSFYSHELYMRYVALITFTLFIIYYYGTLLMPLDQKALILILSGLICLICYYLVTQQKSSL